MEKIVETTLKELLEAAGLQYSGIARNDVAGQMVFSIQADDARALIGMHGDTVHALDLLVKKIVEKRLPAGPSRDAEAEAEPETPHFLAAATNYKTKQIKEIKN